MDSREQPTDDATYKALLWAGGSVGGTGIFIVGLFTLLDVLITAPVWHDWRLDARGVATEATPLSMRVVGAGSHEANTVVSHYIRVRFEDEDDDEHEAELMAADTAVFARVSNKQPIMIEYDPEEPELIRLAGGSASLFGNLTLILDHAKDCLRSLGWRGEL